MDSLEIRHDPASNTSEAPLQMKSNCGCLLIDDFGRQRIEPAELLNRWIIPLENRHDFLTLSTGKKIQVPFEQLIIFSTNLEPQDLVDEAFLRRIPYRIQIGDPNEQEFQHSSSCTPWRQAASTAPTWSITCWPSITGRTTANAPLPSATCSARSETAALYNGLPARDAARVLRSRGEKLFHRAGDCEIAAATAS